MDWNLRSCSWRGHETYAPDEPELRAKLHVTSPAGEAWRCLRCGNYVVGSPKQYGPAALAPEVPRGRMLRDRTLMRVVAAERALRAIGLLGLAVLVLRFRDSHDALQVAFTQDLPLLKPLADQIGWNVNQSAIVRTVNEAFTLSPTVLTCLAALLAGYAVLQAAEAVGLWLVRRWGEYLAVVATSVFLPLEVYELSERVTVLRLLALVVNVVIVVWLVWSKRLFGVRGGGRAYHAEHEAESLLTIERSAGVAW